jgi:uncharacterized protein (DUF427 family)
MRPPRLVAGPLQESVWNYPRPPRLEPTPRRVRIVFAGVEIADTGRAWRVLETSHPPVYYLPRADVRCETLIAAPESSFCEWKGRAVYWTVRVGRHETRRAAWSYPAPAAAFAPIRGHLAFFAGAMDECTVGGELVRPQAGGFYGGWITDDVVGPFKGEPGTDGW